MMHCFECHGNDWNFPTVFATAEIELPAKQKLRITRVTQEC